MIEQEKLTTLMNVLLKKVIHPDLYEQIEIQMNKADNEFRLQCQKDAMGKEFMELKPMLEEYRRTSFDVPKKFKLEAIVEKIKELYG